MGWRVLLPLVLASALQAQFSGLSSTSNGSSIFFASSLRQHDTQQFLWSKIFQIDASGAALVAERAQTSPVPPTNDYWLDQPQVSGDGQLVVFRGTSFCGCCSSCFLSEQHTATLLNTVSGQSSYVGPNARISRNGRYLASYSSGNVFGPVFKLEDLTSAATLFQGSFAPSTVSIAADGTTALTTEGALDLVKGGNLTTLVGGDVSAAAMDDGATTIIYQTQSRKRLYVMDLNSGQTQQLGPDDRDSFEPALSADGQWVAYVSTIGTTPQVFFSHVDGSDWKQLTTGNEGVVECTLSGDSSTVFAVLADGSLLRIDTASGSATTLVGPTPTIGDLESTTPGSLATLQGTGLENATVSLSGAPAPILGRSASEILFQVPWETPLGMDTVVFPQGGAPYFDDAATVEIEAFLPEPIMLGPTDPVTGWQPIAIHTDFRSLVTGANPAAPGEIVHIYVTGGGPVSEPPPTGLPNPVKPLSPITTPISVTTDTLEALDVSFFGLAPGLVGVWQMDVALPTIWSRTTVSIQIQWESAPPNAFWESITFPPIPIKTGQ